MKKKEGFFDVIDELNWCALNMSEGNIVAADEFVKERNRNRKKIKAKEFNGRESSSNSY